MKICCISDTHTRGRRIQIPECDLLIHAGDATFDGSVAQIRDFGDWLDSLDQVGQIVMTPGNHDWLFERDPDKARELVSAATVLIDEECEVGGLRIYGYPWTPEFRNWAFNADLARRHERLELIPEGLDILISHGPPYGHRDKSTRRTQNIGCPALYNRVIAAAPRLVVCGHIHGGYGVDFVGDTTVVNASVCTEQYQPTNAPIVIEL